jgi:hypothetical protein
MTKSNTGATIQLVSRGSKADPGDPCFPALDDFWVTSTPTRKEDGDKEAGGRAAT